MLLRVACWLHNSEKWLGPSAQYVPAVQCAVDLIAGLTQICCIPRACTRGYSPTGRSITAQTVITSAHLHLKVHLGGLRLDGLVHLQGPFSSPMSLLELPSEVS